MTLNRRQVLAGGLGLASAAGLSACSGLTSKQGADAPAKSGGGPATLTFVNWSGDVEKAAFDKVIAAFMAANPEITIKTDTVPYNSIQTNLDSRFQSGHPPDLFRVSYTDIGQYTDADVLLDLSSVFSGAKADAFVPGLFQSVVADGKPYGAPHQIDTTAIVYRKDLFKAANITNVPQSLDQAWSWDEFASVANKLKGVVKGKQSPFIYDWQSAGAFRWLTWLFEAGGTFLGSDLKSPAIDSAQGRKALDFTKSFFTNGWVARNSSTKSTTYPDDAFNAGTVAMAFAGSFLIPGINSGVKKKFEFGSMPQPRDAAASSDLGGNAIVAAKDGQNTDAAKKFLEFIVTEEQQRNYCEATNQLPTLKSLVDAKLNFAIRPDLMDPFVKQANTITADQVKQVTVKQFGKLNVALQNELDVAFLGGRSTGDTVAALSAAITKASS